MEKNIQSGFTLVELMTALAVAGILLAIGVPSFADAMKNSRTSACYNSLVQTLYLARSEAVKASDRITVCARSSDSQCGSNWDNGWLAFVDKDFDSNEDTAVIDNVADVLAVQGDTECKPSIQGVGSTDNTASSATNRNYIRYQSDGQSDWASGSFLICDDRGNEQSRAINIIVTGDIRRGRPSTDTKIPLDVFGRQVSCP